MNSWAKIFGILALLVVVFIATAIGNPASFLQAYTQENVLRLTGLFGILSIGVAFVIISGGIDLSIGSVVGLVGCLLPYLMVEKGWPPAAAILAAIVVSLAIGTTHGLLIAKLRLQPFIVTLCGLMIYRGIARWFTGDATQGFGGEYAGLRELGRGKIPLVGEMQVPVPFLTMIVLAIGAAVVLNKTVYGRYLLALGRNEQAARFSGIRTDRTTLLAYVFCSLMAGVGGILFALYLGSIQPSGHGEFYELYAIAAAVLGGCSLRGGEGSILGVVIGAALMQYLYNSISMLDIPTTLEFVIIGAVILAGVIADEIVRRVAIRRRAAAEAARAKK